MSIAWWPHTDDPKVASFRLRCLQVVEALRRNGRDAWVYQPGRRVSDILVLSKRYDMQTLAHALELRARHGTRLVLDLCDNHFYYEQDAAARLHSRAEQLRHAVRKADLVVTASEELAGVVTAECPGVRTPMVIPDAAEPPRGHRRFAWLLKPRLQSDVFRLEWALRRSRVPWERRLLWFGNHGSPGVEGGMADLARIRAPLEAACRKAPLWLTVVSNDANKYREVVRGWSIPGSYIPWHLETFSRIASLHGAAVIPVSPNPFTLCKTNNRLATAFLHGMSVIANRIPSYVEFSECAIFDDWATGFGSYLDDLALRARHVQAARQMLSQRYSMAAISERWQAALDALHMDGLRGQDHKACSHGAMPCGAAAEVSSKK